MREFLDQGIVCLANSIQFIFPAGRYDGKNNNNLYLLSETHYVGYVFQQIKPLYFCISSPYSFVFFSCL